MADSQAIFYPITTKVVAHLREYKHHLLGLAQAYGKFHYLFLDQSKRRALSLLLWDFLRCEYGLELPALRPGSANGAVPRASPRLKGAEG